MGERRLRRQQILLAIRPAAVILAPSHFSGIGDEVGVGDMMTNADLGAVHSREKRLGVIRASLLVGIGPLVIDPLRQKAIV